MSRGPDVNWGEATALRLACFKEDPNISRKMMILLMTQPDCDVDTGESNGRTTLMAAARSGDFAAVKLLLEHGADANFKDSDGRTALDYARYNSTEEGLKTQDLLTRFIKIACW